MKKSKDRYSLFALNKNVFLIFLVFLIVLIFVLVMSTRFTGNPACRPCFRYFLYVEHNSNQLVIKNGDKEITNIASWEGTSSIPQAQPVNKMTISGVSISDGEKVWISYKIDGIEKKDSAILHLVT